MRIKNNYRKKTALLAGILLSLNLFAEQSAASPSNDKSNTYYLLATIAVVLLMPIVILGRTLLFSIKAYLEKQKKTADLTKLVLPFLLMGITSANAQDAQVTVAPPHHTDTTLWVLATVILLEIVVILFLALKSVWFIKKMIKAETVPVAAEAAETLEEPGLWTVIWQKMNKFKPMEKEAELDTGHNYDGIRELNNITPPWFTAAFVISIIFAVIYLWRYHVSHTAPLMIDEFKTEMAEAAQAQEEYLKKAANLVDEKTVVLLSGTELDAGKKIFTEKCVACHKPDGGGSVGPNLTDDYWLHGGKINDVFKTIKYGVPAKGMISWKDQLSPKQIAQVASFIKSLQGTNPPGGKQAEGQLYKEEPVAKADTVKTTTDTLKIKGK